MPRRNRPRREDPAPLRPGSTSISAAAPPGWQALLRGETGSARTYVCPRCDRSFDGGPQHIVAWRTEEPERRRHWHTACWQAALREGIDRYRWT